MADPAPAIEGATGKLIGGEGSIILLNGGGYFLLQFGGDDLVGINIKQPGLAAFFGGGVFLAGKAFPGLAKDFCAEGFGDFVRAVADVVVEDDDDFAYPAGNTFQ